MDRYEPFGSQQGASRPPEPQDEEPIFDGDGNPQPALPSPELPSVDDKQDRMNYMRHIAPLRRPGNKWPWLTAGIVIILLIIGGLLLGTHHSKKPTPKTLPAPAKVAPSPAGGSTALVHYTSNGQDLNLSFNYPVSWTPNPASGGNSTDQTITVGSPLMTVANAAGSSVTGKAIISIRPVSAQLNELASGNPTAAQASVQIGYSEPTANQFQYPFLTFVHVPASGAPTGAFQEVFVTGTTSFNSGDSLTPDSFSVDPIISASFYTCLDQECSGAGATPLNITNDTWQNSDLFKQTLSIIESLQLN